MNIAVWIIQVLLGVMFSGAGFFKLTSPIEALHAQMPWSNDLPDLMVRFIGLSELLGGIGLLLPSILRIQPRLSVLAALGLAVVMVLAAGDHIIRGEYPFIVVNIVLGGLAAFVAWARTKKVPIQPRA